MKLKELKCTIIGIIVALVLTGLFNVAYWFTLLVIDNKQYSLNLACAAILVTVVGVIIDLLRSIHLERPEKVISDDLVPKGYKTVQPPNREEIPEKSTQTVEELGQIFFNDGLVLADMHTSSLESEQFTNNIQ